MLKMRMRITPAGEITFYTDEGTFENGKLATEAVQNILNAKNTGLKMEIGEVEQHRHDSPDAGEQVTAGTHNHD